MAAPMTWKITTVRQGQRLTPAGLPERTRVVVYNVGTHGPFELEVPEADFNQQTVRKLLDEQVAHLNGLMPT